MSLSGTFRETSFADLLQFYAVSKQTVALEVRREAGGPANGIFYFANGDLVGASLGGAEGREAVRRALRLRDGVFTIQMGAQAPAPGVAETLRNVVMEEVVQLDEEDRARAARPGEARTPASIAADSRWWAAPDRGAEGRPAPTPPVATPSRVAPPPPAPPVPRAATAARVAAAPAPRPAGATPNPPVPAATPAPPPGPIAAKPAAATGLVPAPSSPSVTRGGTPPSGVSIAPAPPPAAGAPEAAAAPTAPAPAPAPPERTPERTPRPAPAGPQAAPVRANAARSARRPTPPPRRGRKVAVVAAVGLVALGVAGAAGWVIATKLQAPLSPAAAAVRGVLDDELVLGMVASFTGSNKERGRAMRLGWEIAISEANEAGGVHGRKLRLVAQDDGYDPARTAAAMKDVIETQGAFAVVGNVGTATAAVAVPYCAEKDAIFFGALSGADLLRKSPPERHVFNYRAGLAAEAAAAVRYLVDVRRVPPARVSVLSQDDDFGRSGKRGALDALRSYGVAESSVLSLSYARNTADVRDAVANLRARAADVDAVVMVATYKPAATFVRKSKEARLALFFTTVSADSNGLAEELVVSGEGYTENVLLTQVVPVPSSPASALIRYRAALGRWAPGEKPGSTSLEAWIGAQIFLEALRRTGRELDSSKLTAALEGIRDWDIGIGAPITFGPADHQGSDMVFGWLMQPDGSYRQVELE